jgi:uncharacterized membrane protein YciS (DUF1049 family)
MSPQTLRILVPVVLIVHGVGHTMGILPALGLASTKTWHSKSWLLTPVFGDKTARTISVILWLVAALGAIGAGLGAFGWLVTQGAWRTLALVSAIVSLVGLVLFWNAFSAFFNKAGAIGVDVATLAGILLLNWPPPDLIL